MSADSSDYRHSVKENFFGYDIPMPRSDLFIALATVISFLPLFVVGYRSVAWLYNSAVAKKRA